MIRSCRSGIQYVLGAKVENPAESAWRFVGFVTAALVAVVVYQWVYVEATVRRTVAQSGFSGQRVISEYVSSPLREIAIGEDDPRLGPDDARMRLVIFSSFQCPSCRKIGNEINYLREHFGDSVQFVFKHFPLSTTCNSKVTSDKHPRSCQMAWAAEAGPAAGQVLAVSRQSLRHGSPLFRKDDPFDRRRDRPEHRNSSTPTAPRTKSSKRSPPTFKWEST